MKKNCFTLTILSLILITSNAFGQMGVFEVCNTFDSNLIQIAIDSNGSWQIGIPTKSTLNGSYNSQNSIVTGIDSLYENNDTSIFIATYTFQHANDWRVLPPSIEFDHRFVTDSISDFGQVELSFDYGVSWIDLLSDTLNSNAGSVPGSRGNFHVYENSNDTIYDRLNISGNSGGWIHSKFYKDVWATDSTFLVKFTFITDSIGRNEGWQIDNLCIAQDIISGVNKIENIQELTIYPNPNKGIFTVENSLNEINDLEIFDLKGVMVYSQKLNAKELQQIQLELKAGMYIVEIGKGKNKQISKMIIE